MRIQGGQGGGRGGGQGGGRGVPKGSPATKQTRTYTDDYYYGDDAKSGDDGYGNDDGNGDDQYYAQKSSKKNSKGKGGGKYVDDHFYPTIDDVAFLDDKFFDDAFFQDGDCELVSFNETFAMPGPSLFLAPDTTAASAGTPDLPGTVFMFERQSILELDGKTAINGSTVSGSCTRTTIGAGGGGICQLVFIDDKGFTVSVEGFLPNPLGGPMAISGGTGGLVGVIGEMDFFPIFDGANSTGDVFLDSVRYEVIADLGLIVCPPKQ
jgi:hypothetical protein